MSSNTLKISKNSNEYLSELDAINIPRRKNGFTFASLYCGGGGLDLGFASAGFKPVFSSDIVESYCETIEHNLGSHLVEAHDIRELSGKDVKKKVGQAIDVVLGGPPCQSFSILGDRKSINDPRGKLVYEYIRFIKETRPKAFIFENVPGILTVNKGKDWKSLIEYFHLETGYSIHFTKLNSVTYGVPQSRERVVIVGFRKKTKFNWPSPSHSPPSKNLDLDLYEPRQSWMALENIDDGLANHILRVHSDRVRNRYKKVEQGGRCRVDHTDRIDPEKPSGTVLVGSGAGGGRPFIHPYEPRHITVREAARLQSFPDWWEFMGGPTASYRQVGNAVPPMMARVIAKALQKALRT